MTRKGLGRRSHTIWTHTHTHTVFICTHTRTGETWKKDELGSENSHEMKKVWDPFGLFLEFRIGKKIQSSSSPLLPSSAKQTDPAEFSVPDADSSTKGMYVCTSQACGGRLISYDLLKWKLLRLLSWRLEAQARINIQHFSSIIVYMLEEFYILFCLFGLLLIRAIFWRNNCTFGLCPG